MGKLRVHELAKKLGLENKELIEKLKAAGIAVKTHSSSVDEAEAMKALGAKSPEEKKAAPKRPRTIVRRRRSDEDAAAEAAERPDAEAAEADEEGAEEKEAPAEAAPAESAEKAEEQPEPAERIEAEAVEAPQGDAEQKQAASAEAPPPAKEQVAACEPKPKEREPAPAAEAAPADGDAEQKKAEPKPSNVVRRIDPQAIRERLAAEGRTFQPPKPKRQFSQVREIRVLHDRAGGGPQLVDVTGTGGARPGKQRKTDDALTARERRELRGGGRDLWLNPGKKKKSGKKGRGPEITQAAAHKRVVEMSDAISVGDLAHQMAIKAGQVISKLMSMGMMVTVNQTVDYETAAIVASEFGFEVKNVSFEEQTLLEEQTLSEGGEEENLEPRAPVVTVMGHVDHGKTSLLDAIRKSNVVAAEAGGITQHIGAYSVQTPKGLITFLDTPGHEAFTSMRARGAQITDIVVLVVAADDGVMPQTVEAINHAKAAKVPIVVAINKCDKPDAKPERVMQELTEYELVPEEWGGEVIMKQVSAIKKTGLDDLLESILLQAEILELKANPNRRAQGAIVEAQIDKGRGPVATVLVQQGTLHQGDYIVAGEHHGRVRAMYNSKGEKVETAGPSMPVQVLGLSGVPSAGDQLHAVADDKTAKRIAEHRQQKAREQELQKTSRVSLENFLKQGPQDEEGHELRLLVKADVDGSVEALTQALNNLSTRKVKVSIVHSGVGTITENDINLALASNAIVIGFNTKPDAKAHALAQHEKVDVRTYAVIYEALEEVRAAMAGLLAPKLEERQLGVAEVRALFNVPKLGTIAGCYVTDGKIVRSGKVRVRRGDEVVFEGQIASLKRFKDDVREVAAGYECGIGVQGYSELKEGDRIECFELEEVKAELDEAIVELEGADTGGTQAGAPA